MIPNYDQEIEKHYHPENFEEIDPENKGVPSLLDEREDE